jgi:hypothetical protein
VVGPGVLLDHPETDQFGFETEHKHSVGPNHGSEVGFHDFGDGCHILGMQGLSPSRSDLWQLDRPTPMQTDAAKVHGAPLAGKYRGFRILGEMGKGL